jgi:hypothetical protein
MKAVYQLAVALVAISLGMVVLGYAGSCSGGKEGHETVCRLVGTCLASVMRLRFSRAPVFFMPRSASTYMCSNSTFVTQAQCDHRHVHTGLKKMHCGRVSNHMRRY